MRLSCVCGVKKSAKASMIKDFDTYDVNDLESSTGVDYLSTNWPKTIFLFLYFK